MEALREAISQYGCQEIFNTDQGCQFSSQECTEILKGHNIPFDMDGAGRWRENLFIERLWQSLKYEEVYLRDDDTIREAQQGMVRYLTLYDQVRPHHALEGHIPQDVSARYHL